jgi:hypothetical protein
VEKIFDTLRYNPLIVEIGSEPGDYAIVNYGLVRRAIFSILYQPFSSGGKDASIILVSLERGDGH